MKTLLTSILAISLFGSSNGFSQEAPREIEPVAPTQTSDPAPAAPVEYVIRSGDNPWKIAKDHKVSLDDLLAANEIEDATNLKIGDVLVIPTGETAPAAKPVAKKVEKVQKPAPAPETAAPDGADWEYYTIKSGDNPWSISRALKRDHQKIMALNEGMNFNDLKVGQQIKIPTK